MPSVLQKLKERKLVQWVLAYLAGAWLVLQVMDVLEGPLNLAAPLQLAVLVCVLAGFFVAVVVAWYHGEQGEQRVSGIEILILAVVLLGAGGLLRAIASGSGAERPLPEPEPRVSLAQVLYENPVVAILPPVELADGEDRQFADGVHVETWANLEKVGSLTLVSRSAALQYRGTDKTPAQIAAELDADALLEINVRTAGERLRVTVTLIDGATQRSIWSDVYDRELTTGNLFDVQESVAREVVEALSRTLSRQESERIAAKGTQNLDAYRTYLASMQLASSELSIQLTRDALRHDSTFAEAWGLLAMQSTVVAQNLGQEWADSAVYAANRAIELDPTVYRAHMALAGAHYLGWGRLREALASSAAAVDVAPNSPTAARFRGELFQLSGRYPEALRWFKRAERLSSTTVRDRGDIAEAYLQLGLEQQADSVISETLADVPDNHVALRSLSLLETLRGSPAEAYEAAEARATTHAYAPRHAWLARLAFFDRDWEHALEHARIAVDLSPQGTWGVEPAHGSQTTIGYALLMTGDTVAADKHLEVSVAQLMDALDEGSQDPWVFAELAAVESVRGNRDEAVDWIQRSYDFGFRYIAMLELDPMYDALRDDPTFDAVLSRMRDDVESMRQQALQDERALRAIAGSR